MTIKDLAQKTGYAVGTVSRALNNHPNVSEKAREEILRAAAQYGFRLNENAQRLKQTRSNTILGIVKGKRNELFAQMVEEIQSRIMDECNMALMGKTLEVLVDGFDPEQEQFYGRTYADSPEIDGRVWIASEEALVEGSFVKVCMDALVDGDLSGYIVVEEA